MSEPTEREQRYVEAMRFLRGAMLHGQALRKVMAVADAEQADLRAEVEQLRESERTAWNVHREHVDLMNPRLLHAQAVADDWKSRAKAAEAKVARVEALVKPQWRSVFYDRNALIDDIRAALADDE